MDTMAVNRQWSTRPDDQRFTSLTDLAAFCHTEHERSRAVTVSSRKLEARPTSVKELQVFGPNGHGYTPTHWAFGQLAQLAGAPAGYLRNLPAPIAADCINYGMKFSRDVEGVGCLLRRNGTDEFAAATGPRYGRIWNDEIASALVSRFGDGVTGSWRVPGEFGQRVTVDKSNTTLYASDRDMFVFLADEDRRIELPNRRNGQSGSLARGFYVTNSEVGASALKLCMFLFDYVCCNRIIWGVEQSMEIAIRHSSGAPDRWLEECTPILREYSEGLAKPILQAIEDARSRRLADDLQGFLANRFGQKVAAASWNAHLNDEGRPPETAWDAVTAVTAYARTIPHQDERVKLEREAGKLLTAT